MNDKLRGGLVRLVGGLGSAACAISVIRFGNIDGLGWLIVLSFLAGTFGSITFTWLATRLMEFEKRRSLGRPGQPVYSFHSLPPEEASAAGGKGKILARMYQAEYPVPDGLVVLPSAFEGDRLTSTGWESVKTQLARLRRGGQGVAFAVRSSGWNEDSAQASFAGELESVLDVQTDEEIRAAIETVRQSRHGERVQAYTQAQGLEEVGLETAVVVQRLVRADFSGVLFTVDPVTGNLAQMAGNFVQGLGEKLVSGAVSAQTFSFERPKGRYNGPAELQPMARALFRNASALETELGGPQDIEWAAAGGRLFILQARPITTLRGFNPVTGDWNDTRMGNFLWSGTNLTEAYPQGMTLFTASMRSYLEERGGPSLTVKHYPLNGVIGGRFYSNLSVQVSAFLPLFRGDAHRAYRELAGWWGDIPEDMDIPVIPLTTGEWFKEVVPMLLRTTGQFGAYRKRIPDFLAGNRERCARLQEKIGSTQTRQELAALWEAEVWQTYSDSIFFIVASGSDFQVRLERELRELVGPEDANALLSNLGGKSTRLESLGPVMGVHKVLRGEMTRAAYLEMYGHRGVNEGECAWPRPSENPYWIDQLLADAAKTPVDIESLLSRQEAAYQAAWQRLCEQHPQKAKRIGKRIEQAAQGARQREAVRSEGVRIVGVVRAFALRVGQLAGIGEDVFSLTIEEVLALLQGNERALAFLPRRKETYRRYRTLPPYPGVIRGRFDPFAWAQQPGRRSDLFDADASSENAVAAGDISAIRGFAGALGVVEGRVRRLDCLEESSQLQPGEVLVTSLTNIGWTPIFPRAAAIITDLGAPLSHAAIVARELGIPAVVGCGDATRRLKTGDRVRVDGGKGRVEILED